MGGQDILLIILIILILDKRQSVEYMARFVIFIFLNMFYLFIYACANLSEKYNN